MSRNFRSIRSSRFLRLAYLVWVLLVISYVLFEVLDVDGSNLPRLLTPLHRSLLVAESIADVAGDGQESVDQRQHGATLSIDAPREPRLARQIEPIRSVARDLLRAHRYRAGSPRDAIAQTPPDH